MIQITLLILIALTASCAAKRDYFTLTEQVSEYGVYRISDKTNGNICYVYRDNDGNSLSCIKGHSQTETCSKK